MDAQRPKSADGLRESASTTFFDDMVKAVDRPPVTDAISKAINRGAAADAAIKSFAPTLKNALFCQRPAADASFVEKKDSSASNDENNLTKTITAQIARFERLIERMDVRLLKQDRLTAEPDAESETTESETTEEIMEDIMEEKIELAVTAAVAKMKSMDARLLREQTLGRLPRDSLPKYTS